MAAASVKSDAILERLTALHPKVIDLSLDRVERLLAALGNPHEKLPPVVHVAGTNGKGSVVAYLRAFLEAAGYRVHVYTSPHLVHFNERIRVAGTLIEDDALAALLEECETANAGQPITFFEITTAAAFLAFARTPADVVLLETGLGGRLDATNVIAKPLLTVITSVSEDHHQYLGETLTEIMGEKAGILKAGVPCVVASQERASMKALLPKANALGAPLVREGEDFFARTSPGGMIYEGQAGAIALPSPALAGGHQIRNAGLALACVERMSGFDVSTDALAAGLRAVEWPARLQQLTRGPLVDMLPDGWELWLDGGHNTGAAKVISAQARVWRDKPLYLVFGLLDTKDPSAYLKALKGRARMVRTVTIPDQPAALSANRLAAVAESIVLDAAPSESVAYAVKGLTVTAPGPARILIAGSLYLAGSVLAENG